MPDAKKLVISDSYKDALAQKETDTFKKTVAAFTKGSARKEQIAKANKQITTSKRQKLIQQKITEIDWYKDKLNKAEKNAKEGTYLLLTRLMFVGFVVAIIITVISYVCDFEQEIMLAALVLSFIFLITSTMFQSKSMHLDLEIREYSAKLKRAKKQLLNLKIPPQN